jgi:hypothetical protein
MMFIIALFICAVLLSVLLPLNHSSESSATISPANLIHERIDTFTPFYPEDIETVAHDEPKSLEHAHPIVKRILLEDTVVMYPTDTTHYTAIILVIVSFDGIYGELFNRLYNVLKLYDRVNPKFKVIYIQCIEDVKDTRIVTYNVDDSLFTLNTCESIMPGIILKYTAALKFVEKNYTYDYVIRSNLSSCLNLAALESVLQRLPKTCLYAGHVHWKLIHIVFCAGPVTISRDLVPVILNRIHTQDVVGDYDDVIIGKICSKFKLTMCMYKSMSYTDEHAVTDELHRRLYTCDLSNVVWLRIRNPDANRLEVDTFIHSKCVQRIYSLNSTTIQNAIDSIAR